MKRYYTLTAVAFLFIHATLIAQQRWTLKLDKDEIKVYTKNCDSSSVKAVKAECILNTSMSALTSVLLNVNNSKEWIYATKKVSVLKTLSATEIIYYSEVSLPWPISNRDFIVDMSVTQDTVTKTVRVITINKPDYLPPSKDIVRIENSFSQWTIRQLPGGRLNVEYELQVNPGGNIPAWLVNLFATTGPFCTFQKLRQQVKKEEYLQTSLAFIRE